MSNTRWKRSEVPKEQTWDLSDLFTSTEEWESEWNTIQTDISEVTYYKGKLGENADTLLNCLIAAEKFEQRVIRVSTFANLRANAYGADPKNHMDSIKVYGIFSLISVNLYFIITDILTLTIIKIVQ